MATKRYQNAFPKSLDHLRVLKSGAKPQCLSHFAAPFIVVRMAVAKYMTLVPSGLGPRVNLPSHGGPARSGVFAAPSAPLLTPFLRNRHKSASLGYSPNLGTVQVAFNLEWNLIWPTAGLIIWRNATRENLEKTRKPSENTQRNLG